MTVHLRSREGKIWVFSGSVHDVQNVMDAAPYNGETVVRLTDDSGKDIDINVNNEISSGGAGSDTEPNTRIGHGAALPAGV